MATLTCPSTGNIRSSLSEYGHGIAAVDRWEREASDCCGRAASLNLRDGVQARALRQFTQSIVVASMPAWLSTSSPRLPTCGESPHAECSDSRDLTWTHRWHQGWRSSSFDSIPLAACPLKTFDPASTASTTTASDGALYGKTEAFDCDHRENDRDNISVLRAESSAHRKRQDPGQGQPRKNEPTQVDQSPSHTQIKVNCEELSRIFVSGYH